jgi:hypothetical protein
MVSISGAFWRTCSIFRITQQLADVFDLFALHPREHVSAQLLGQLGEQVGAFVRRHPVGEASRQSRIERAEDLHAPRQIERVEGGDGDVERKRAEHALGVFVAERAEDIRQIGGVHLLDQLSDLRRVGAQDLLYVWNQQRGETHAPRIAACGARFARSDRTDAYGVRPR